LPAVSERLFDVVVANILRGPLLELQPRLTSYCKPGGRLALSGILGEQVSLSLKFLKFTLYETAVLCSCALSS
jgi:ribosomal protein L11 methylase PrmA